MADWKSEFETLSSALIADACMRLGISLRAAPPGIGSVVRGVKLAGRVLPVHHYGSVDVFIEAMGAADQGDVLVIDNDGRTDEGCIGDLMVLEARASGIEGIVVWGSHRDGAEIESLSFPVFSYGAWPAGPRRLDWRPEDALGPIRFGKHLVRREDIVFADDDGAMFVPSGYAEDVIATARQIRETERTQAKLITEGTRLRDQLRFDEYLELRREDPHYTFRSHLRRLGGEIEE